MTDASQPPAKPKAEARYLPALTLALVLLLAVWAIVNTISEHLFGDRESVQLMQEAFRVIRHTYVKKVDPTLLVRGAIRGMVASLGNPYCSYLPPVQNKLVQQTERGETGGVGIEISFRNHQVVVIAPVEGMPAQKAGILPGDIIAEVDGKSCAGCTLGQVAERIQGLIGTEVEIGVSREGEPKPLRFKLKRTKILVSNVRYQMLEDRIGYVRISLFAERVGQDFRKAVTKLKQKGMAALVLDLRFNPGGIVDEAANVADALIRSGVIVSTRSRHKSEVFTHKAKKATTLFDGPIAVLVNQGSASSSEILSAALRDHGRAILVGVKTFGKGSVAKQIPLADGSSLALIVAKYYTPKGKCIEGKGLMPDVEMPQARIPAPRSNDATLHRAVELLKKRL